MKIFITVGTDEFDELLKEVDRLIQLGKLKGSEIFAQMGNSKYIPKKFAHVKWLTPREMQERYKWADLVICGHGAGTLFELLELKEQKKVISVKQNAKVKLGDFPDLAKELAKSGYILYVDTPKKILYAIKKAKEWRPKKYKKPKCWIEKVIINYLNEA